MSETPKPPVTSGSTEQNTREQMETVVLEANRDLKQFFVRELGTELARIEERFEKRVADIEAELQGVSVKLNAIRQELHQSLRDQTFKVAAIVASLLALAAAWWMLSGRLPQ